MNLSRYKYPLSTLPIRAIDQLGLSLPMQNPIQFVIEKGNWSIKWDGHYISKEVNRLHHGLSELTTSPFLSANRIVHFGSQFQCVSWCKHMAKSNQMICTFFHGKRSDDAAMARHVDDFMRVVPDLSKVITAASMIEDRLIDWGVPREKLVRIPIGIDTSLFKPFTDDEKKLARHSYNIPDNAFVIGSFQKDGNGWGEGLDPKLIKGPDVLVSVAKELSKHVPVFVFLTGPARGYVKKGLDDAGIPYMHEYLDDYLDLPSRFALLDVYINPSREEGGPKGILEAMASGVLVASTRVGMAPDVIHHNENGILVNVEDVIGMTESILDISGNQSTRDRLLENARHNILALDWAHIGRMHYDLVYKDLL